MNRVFYRGTDERKRLVKNNKQSKRRMKPEDAGDDSMMFNQPINIQYDIRFRISASFFHFVVRVVEIMIRSLLLFIFFSFSSFPGFFISKSRHQFSPLETFIR